MSSAHRLTARPRGSVTRLALVFGAFVLLAAATAPGLTPRAAAQPPDCPPPTAAEVEALARDYIAALNTGDMGALDALLAPDYQHHSAVVADQDRELYKQRVRAFRDGFPDGVFTIDWVLVDGDLVAVRDTFRGTHVGELAGVPASGRPVAIGAFHVHRVACGQIAETWNASDAIGMFRQIGVVPGPATTPANQETPPPARAARAGCRETTPAQNAARAVRWYYEVLNQGHFEVLDELLAEDVVHHGAVFVDLIGPTAVGASLLALLEGFPDIQYTVEDVVAAGDTVLIRWSGRGTQDGTFLGVPPSGRSVDWRGMNAFRFHCGQIVEGWSEANGWQVLQQIGAIP